MSCVVMQYVLPVSDDLDVHASIKSHRLQKITGHSTCALLVHEYARVCMRACMPRETVRGCNAVQKRYITALHVL